MIEVRGGVQSEIHWWSPPIKSTADLMSKYTEKSAGRIYKQLEKPTGGLRGGLFYVDQF